MTLKPSSRVIAANPKLKPQNKPFAPPAPKPWPPTNEAKRRGS